ncbi:hypothetical protein ACQEV9_00340 [Streptomyces chartreusis]|nr:hypothetical protein [Streptomyces sp. Lzd4kr]
MRLRRIAERPGTEPLFALALVFRVLASIAARQWAAVPASEARGTTE